MKRQKTGPQRLYGCPRTWGMQGKHGEKCKWGEVARGVEVSHLLPALNISASSTLFEANWQWGIMGGGLQSP
mgnify:CR=1 FL=1